MKTRTIQDLAELLIRIDEHLRARNVGDRCAADLKSWRDGAGDGTIYDHSRVYRWLASWTRRRELVARALACELGLLGIRRDMIPDPMPGACPTEETT